jgi:hypothetical protein
MILIAIYVAMVVVCEVLAFFLGAALDQFVPSAWSMLVYMGMFFGVLWAAWPVSVFVTERWVAPRAAVR